MMYLFIHHKCSFLYIIVHYALEHAETPLGCILLLVDMPVPTGIVPEIVYIVNGTHHCTILKLCSVHILLFNLTTSLYIHTPLW